MSPTCDSARFSFETTWQSNLVRRRKSRGLPRRSCGLVGPNGAGKSTVFRLFVGQEQPDAGQVNVERGVVIGYFDQNVGEMGGESALEATIAGAGEVAVLRKELAHLEAAMADPDKADELDVLVERFGEAQNSIRRIERLRD